MVDIDQIRQAQERRLFPVLKAWEDAKQHLEEAIARAKATEKEVQEISEDVNRKMAALDLVSNLARELGPQLQGAKTPELATANRPILLNSEEVYREEAPRELGASPETKESETGDPAVRGFGGLLRRSSRPLFPNMRRSA
jgi:hypothetical protein